MPRKNRTGRIPIKNITEPVKEEPEIEEEKTIEPET
jgi:hypothetical protein